MPTPPKPYAVLIGEKKSHRTKRELSQRKSGEEALLTGQKIAERAEVKNNKTAHKEFRRIVKLLENIQKNDAIYEPIINRFCMIQAECQDMEEKRETCYQIICNMDAVFREEINNAPLEERAKLIRSYAKAYNESIKSLLSIDSQIQAKRKMLFDIEKENAMTIAAALRTIPKKQEEKKNALLAVLEGDSG